MTGYGDHALQRLVYRSISLIDPGDQYSLTRIVQQSLSNNRRAGITGCLALTDGAFIQVLEGTAGKVGSVMQRIRADSRHQAVAVIGDRPISARLFKHSAMAHVTAARFNSEISRVIAASGGAAHVTSILLELVETQGRFAYSQNV